jgi:hypothetical protein
LNWWLDVNRSDCGGSISNRRLVSFKDNQVAFRYRDHRDLNEKKRPRWKIVRLSVEEFLSRVLAHVPLPGCQTVRSYGLYANTKGETLQQARRQLGQHEPLSQAPLTAARSLERFKDTPPNRCPVCQAALVRHGEFRRSRSPPGVVPAFRSVLSLESSLAAVVRD